jgi:hypothetical protein
MGYFALPEGKKNSTNFGKKEKFEIFTLPVVD